MKKHIRALNGLLEELEEEDTYCRANKLFKPKPGNYTSSEKRSIAVSRALGHIERLLQDLREIDRLDEQ